MAERSLEERAPESSKNAAALLGRRGGRDASGHHGSGARGHGARQGAMMMRVQRVRGEGRMEEKNPLAAR